MEGVLSGDYKPTPLLEPNGGANDSRESRMINQRQGVTIIDRWFVNNIMVLAGIIRLSCDCNFCINMYDFVLYLQLIKYI